MLVVYCYYAGRSGSGFNFQPYGSDSRVFAVFVLGLYTFSATKTQPDIVENFIKISSEKER